MKNDAIDLSFKEIKIYTLVFYKGIILNCMFKDFKIAPVKSHNVIPVTINFYGGFKSKLCNTI